MDILIFLINNYFYGISLDLTSEIERLNVLKEHGNIKIRKNSILKNNINFIYIDLYKIFYFAQRTFNKNNDDYIIFLKNKIFFNVEKIIDIKNVAIKHFPMKKFMNKKYVDFFQDTFIINSQIGFILNEKNLSTLA